MVLTKTISLTTEQPLNVLSNETVGSQTRAYVEGLLFWLGAFLYRRMISDNDINKPRCYVFNHILPLNRHIVLENTISCT